MTDSPDRVERVVREALKAAYPEVGPINGSTHLATELGMDSAQVMDFIMEIEDRLDISIPITTVAEARTLDQLCAGIRRLTDKS